MASRKAVHRPRKQWGFMVFIAGDNNLSDFGLRDIQEMQRVGASSEVHVGVEIDTYGEHTGSIRYEISEPDWFGTSHRVVIERLSERDSGDPLVLQNFLSWGLNRYAATHYVAVVWNHGAGFRSRRRDIAYDDFGSSLDMPEIETALERAGINETNKLAVLGFDACLMNMVEIAHHFRKQVDVLVGSQQTEPGDGWPYHDVLNSIKRVRDPEELGKRIVRDYISDYRQKGLQNVTQSAIKLSKTPALAQALDSLGETLVGCFETQRAALRQIRFHVQSFAHADYVDLLHLAKLLDRDIDEASVRQAARRVRAAAGDCIISSRTLGTTVADAGGLSIWFPAGAELFQTYRSKYMGLDFAKAARGWISFLETYHLGAGN